MVSAGDQNEQTDPSIAQIGSCLSGGAQRIRQPVKALAQPGAITRDRYDIADAAVEKGLRLLAARRAVVRALIVTIQVGGSATVKSYWPLLIRAWTAACTCRIVPSLLRLEVTRDLPDHVGREVVLRLRAPGVGERVEVRPLRAPSPLTPLPEGEREWWAFVLWSTQSCVV